MNNTDMDFPTRLRALRKQAKLTQESLALACGWSGQSRIANYESTGDNAREPSLAELPTLAKALRVSVGELLGAAELEVHQDYAPDPVVSREIELIAETLAQATQRITALQSRLMPKPADAPMRRTHARDSHIDDLLGGSHESNEHPRVQKQRNHQRS